MEDTKIIDLYFERDEQAIAKTQEKYHHYLYTISFNILKNNEDSEENINDTYMKTWNSIPPQRPTVFSAFLAKINRNGAIDMVRKKQAAKRGCNEYDLCVDEFSDSLAALDNVEQTILAGELVNQINEFLKKQPEKKRVMFVRRYFYMDSVEAIAKALGLSESNVKTTLCRMRKELCECIQ